MLGRTLDTHVCIRRCTGACGPLGGMTVRLEVVLTEEANQWEMSAVTGGGGGVTARVKAVLIGALISKTVGPMLLLVRSLASWFHQSVSVCANCKHRLLQQQ